MTSSDPLAAVRNRGSSTAYYNPSFADNIEEIGVESNLGCPMSHDSFNQKYGFSEKPLPTSNRKIHY